MYTSDSDSDDDHHIEMDDSSQEEEEDSDDSLEEKEMRNWLELPPDVMTQIFLKLDTIDILFRVQSVCSSWRKLAKEPQLYRKIDMQLQWQFLDKDELDWEKMTREAVDRSCGQCVDFAAEQFATHETLQYIADKHSPLQRLRLVSCYRIYDEVFIEIVKKFPLLEEVEICHHSFLEEALEAIGHSCPLLKYFRLNCTGYNGPNRLEYACDEEALAIARSMPGLHHLHLFGNFMTDTGLEAILDGCSHLKSLDLRQCFNLTFAGDLKKRCADRNIEFKLPNDSTIGYEFDTNCTGYL